MPRTVAIACAAAALLGCVTTSYAPSERHNHAAAIRDNSGAYVSLIAPRVKAISLDPPFKCDAYTVQLANHGAELTEAPTDVRSFGGFVSHFDSGVYRVRTVQGSPDKPGETFIVISGEDSSDPAVSLLNVVNRYNDVVECVNQWGR